MSDPSNEMTFEQARIQTILEKLAEQRNEAQDRVAILAADLQLAQITIANLQKELGEFTEQKVNDGKDS